MIDKLSEGITSAFNTAGTEANKAKLQTEIAMKQHQIKGIKQEFGVRGQCMKSNRTSRRPHWPPSGRGAPGAARLGAVTAESWPPWTPSTRRQHDGVVSPVDFNDCAQVAAWDLMARDDTAGLQALFKQRQATAQNVIGDLGKLQRQLADLGGPKPTHVVSVTVPAGSTLCRNQFLGASFCTRLTG